MELLHLGQKFCDWLFFEVQKAAPRKHVWKLLLVQFKVFFYLSLASLFLHTDFPPVLVFGARNREQEWGKLIWFGRKKSRITIGFWQRPWSARIAHPNWIHNWTSKEFFMVVSVHFLLLQFAVIDSGNCNKSKGPEKFPKNDTNGKYL